MVETEVKKTAKSLVNAWELGYFLRVMDVSLKEIKDNMREGRVTRDFFNKTKEKIDALRYVEKTTGNEALRHWVRKHALEMEAYHKGMGLVLKA